MALLERYTASERAPGGGRLQEYAGNPKSIRTYDEKIHRTAQEGENPAQNGEREQRTLTLAAPRYPKPI